MKNVNDKGKPCDDDQLTLDIAAGKAPLSQIARKHRLSDSQMYNIAKGRSRPRIRQRLVRLWKMALEDLRRASAAKVKEIMDLHIEVALSDKGHVGRMSREYVLDRMVSDQDLRLEEADTDEAGFRTPAGRWRAARKRIQARVEGGRDDR